MKDTNFKINRVNGTIIIEKNNERFEISQALDDDIWFATSKPKLSLEISNYSRDYSEWNTYIIFENLMKLIIGRYMLSGDNKNEDGILPNDFINLDSKTIIWHSDNGTDNSLKLEYNKRNITINILKNIDASSDQLNSVRIRTNGSIYGRYYKEFLSFFRELSILERRLNKPLEIVEPKQEETNNSGKLSLSRTK